MKKRKQSNRNMLEKHRREYQHNLDDIARLNEKNKELMQIITEEENVEYISLIRSFHLGLDEFESFLNGLRNGGVSFPMTESSVTPQADAPMTAEQTNDYPEQNDFYEEANPYEAQ